MKTTKTQITIIALIVLLIAAGGYVVNKEYIEPKQLEYAQQGAMQIIQEINTNGNIPVVNNGTVVWIPIQEICSRWKQLKN